MQDIRQRFLLGIQKIEGYGIDLETIQLKEGKKRFRISISVPKSKTLIITTKGLSDKKIDEFLVTHAKWVYLRLKRCENEQLTLNFGDKITLFDNEYTILEGINTITENIIYIPSQDKIKEVLLNIMSIMTKEYMPKLTESIAVKYDFKYNSLGVTKDKSKWGYCNVTRKEIKYNRLIALTNSECRYYIAVHELCHLKELGHTPYFWALVESIMPDYKKYRKILKKSTTLIDYFSS